MEVGSSARLPVLPPGGVSSAAPSDPVSSATSDGTFAPQAAPPASVKDPPRPATDARDELRRQMTLDEDSHRIVYQGIDQLTGEIVFQLPDPRYLKAYVDQQKKAEQQADKRVPSASQVA